MPEAANSVQHPAERDPVNVAGVRVDSFTEAELVRKVLQMVAGETTDVAVGINAHVCNLAAKSSFLNDFLGSATTYADGQSVVWAARLLGGELPERLATTDIAIPICQAAAEAGIGVYFLGAAEGIAEIAAERVRGQAPGIKLLAHHGYLDTTSTETVLNELADNRIGILFIGMGDPTQQEWVERYRDRLPPAVLTCGGLFDWLSGTNRRAPDWMIRAGLEWFWRLVLEPRRLAYRYLIGNPRFVAAVWRQRRQQSAETSLRRQS